LRPHAIAVVGASADPNTIAGLLFGNLVDSHFGGSCYGEQETSDGAGYRRLSGSGLLPSRPDLVVVCVPASAVTGSRPSRCSRVNACVSSQPGSRDRRRRAALQANVVQEACRARAARRSELHGILGGTAEERFNATFSRAVPRQGDVLLSQSGAIGLAVLEAAETRGLGIGAFVSVGNSTDVASNDLLFTGPRPAPT